METVAWIGAILLGVSYILHLMTPKAHDPTVIGMTVELLRSLRRHRRSGSGKQVSVRLPNCPNCGSEMKGAPPSILGSITPVLMCSRECGYQINVMVGNDSPPPSSWDTKLEEADPSGTDTSLRL